MTRTFDEILARLVHNYRQPINVEMATDYQRELADVRLSQLDSAVTLLMRTRKFMPNLAEILEAVHVIRQQDPATQRQRPFEPCSECVNGWIHAGPSRELEYLAGYDAAGKALLRKGSGNDTVRRCACWIQWRRSQGLAVPTPRPTLQVDIDRAIGYGDESEATAVTPNWTTARALVETKGRKLRRIAGGKR